MSTDNNGKVLLTDDQKAFQAMGVPALSNEEYVDAGGFACPGCGDTRFLKVERFIVAHATLRCTECKATWNEEYTLARYSNFNRDPSAYEPAPTRPVMVYDPLADISRANYNEPGLHTR